MDKCIIFITVVLIAVLINIIITIVVVVVVVVEKKAECSQFQEEFAFSEVIVCSTEAQAGAIRGEVFHEARTAQGQLSPAAVGTQQHQ
jgi:hypothetical protein